MPKLYEVRGSFSIPFADIFRSHLFWQCVAAESPSEAIDRIIEDLRGLEAIRIAPRELWEAVEVKLPGYNVVIVPNCEYEIAQVQKV